MLDIIFTEDSFRPDQPETSEGITEQAFCRRFAEDRYAALFELGFCPKEAKETPTFSFLHSVAAAFLHELTSMPDLEVAREHIRVDLTDDTYDSLIRAVPFGLGTEYIGRAWLSLQFMRLNAVFAKQMGAYEGTVSLFLTEHNQDLRVPERIFFHLVENTEDKDDTFAFLATYATRDEEGGVKHMPLSYALIEYEEDRQKLLELLSCLNKVAEISQLLGSFIDSGEIFHALRLTPEEAYGFLLDVPRIEEAGIVCRVPNWWKNHYSTVGLQVSLGDEKPDVLGFDTIISMKPVLVVDGVPLSREEIDDLLRQTEGLARLKGKWVEVNHDRLTRLLEKMDKYGGRLSLLEALRLEAGLKESQDEGIDIGPDVTNGQWLGGFLKNLRQPETIHEKAVPDMVNATLRSYQKTGFEWLGYLTNMGFGACLADDMGLGKTLQTLAFLAEMYEENPEAVVLLVAPASLVGNWQKEVERFTPHLPFRLLHGARADDLEKMFFAHDVFLNITTYGMALRMEGLRETTFDCLILDEAQAIKNPGTKQTRAIKHLKARRKIALTGTPIENDLFNLWSLFDFLNKGLLGTSDEFRNFTKGIAQHPQGYQKLKAMITPFILRRLKSDKRIIPDLPDKVEKVEYLSLSAKQIVLYRKQVAELEKSIEGVDGMARRGMVLGTITKLKQICNHPDQYMGQERYSPKESGKFELLRTLCETIYEKRERVLLFTQYKEIIPALERFLEGVFQRKGLVIHGGVPVKRRQQLVEKFNGEDYVPFMILSLRAGGTGLNLTSANHVIHFDRWWNPAVENQATDRAYRIGQGKTVIVHKFVSKGTIEEKINRMLEDKSKMAEQVIGASSGENWITELSNEALLDLMRLE
ncbi:MAG: DEAD/DEAH box helicase [Lachnospiraceae bacterium]|nr:DEAD/DEAH box helicase [Lachnospiraceae bacterium]